MKMPALSPTMDKGTIVSWRVKEGDKIGPGDCVCEIETDKSKLEFEYQEEGYIAKILKPAGSKDIRIGEVCCLFTLCNITDHRIYSFVPSFRQLPLLLRVRKMFPRLTIFLLNHCLLLLHNHHSNSNNKQRVRKPLRHQQVQPVNNLDPCLKVSQRLRCQPCHQQ